MRTALGVAGGAVLGVIAGYFAFGGGEQPKAEAELPPVCPACPTCAATSDGVKVIETRGVLDAGATPQERCASAERSVADLSAQLAAMDEQLRAVNGKLQAAEDERLLREGKPLQKPADLPARFEQAQMQRAFEAAIKEAGLDMQVTSVDCTEYPCIVYGQGRGGRDEFKKLDQTKALDDYNPDGRWGWGWGAPNGDGGSAQYFGVTFLPTDNGPKPERDKRINFRVDEMKAATGGK